ncbi:MAG: hypothetical protein HY655_05045 [Acidobacteria bacterium]|nr:hypothetical protein [Acidobacteriota bacterium]
MATTQFPLIHNWLFDTYPMLVHAAGKSEQLPLWPSIVRAAERWRVDTRLDPNLTVITFNNGGSLNQPYKRLGLFEESLRRSGVDEIAVLGQAVTEWKHNLKINLLLEYLNTAAVKDYVLVADSADVILTNDIEPLVERFKAFGCRAVFNAERRHYPGDLPPFDEQVASGEYFPCLNSGIWVADTSFARELADYCARLTVEKHKKCDQTRYKTAYRQFYPAIRVDHRCRLFQNINRVEADVVALHDGTSSGQ